MNLKTDEINFNQRLKTVFQNIEEACVRTGRDPQRVELMAVTKTLPLSSLLMAYEAGCRLFGENRISEAAEKRASLPKDAHIHMIGNIQSNKAHLVSGVVSMVQSVWRSKTLHALNKGIEKNGAPLEILLEVNTSGEESKEGVRSFDELKALAKEALQIGNSIHLRGLMTMAPWVKDETVLRPCFRKLKAFRDQLEQELGFSLPILSMGMSNDYPIAIEEGSTLVRVGTALFGERG